MINWKLLVTEKPKVWFFKKCIFQLVIAFLLHSYMSHYLKYPNPCKSKYLFFMKKEAWKWSHSFALTSVLFGLLNPSFHGNLYLRIGSEVIYCVQYMACTLNTNAILNPTNPSYSCLYEMQVFPNVIIIIIIVVVFLFTKELGSYLQFFWKSYK